MQAVLEPGDSEVVFFKSPVPNGCRLDIEHKPAAPPSTCPSPSACCTQACQHNEQGAAEGAVDTPAMLCADLLKRVFKIDIFECRCQARMQKISVIAQPKVIGEIPECVGLLADSPPVHPSEVHLQIDLAI